MATDWGAFAAYAIPTFTMMSIWLGSYWRSLDEEGSVSNNGQENG